MNLQNYRLEPNPNTPGDWIVFGDIYDNDGNLLGTFGENGTSVFAWWVMQDAQFQHAASQLRDPVRDVGRRHRGTDPSGGVQCTVARSCVTHTTAGKFRLAAPRAPKVPKAPGTR